jgi:hypothetical protein
MPIKIRQYSAVIFAILMVAAALLHVYWALGGTCFLAQASGGFKTPYAAGQSLPPDVRLSTWGLVFAMLSAMLLVLGRAGFLLRRIPQWLYSLGCWGVTIVMLFGSINGFITPQFWNRYVFGPIFLLLFVLSLIVALPGKLRATRV